MRILIFHGYLLRGTGSNVYNAELAAALARAGHDVHLLTQEPRPAEIGLPAGVTVHRPEIGEVLPVYVADRYEGVEARTFLELDDTAVDAYVAANVAAVAELRARHAFDAALANHLVMGPLILARGLAGAVPYAVKVHGSALEYVVKRDPGRFLPAAREGLAGASAILVGSRHTAESLWAALDDLDLPARTRLGPPGVDVDRFVARSPAEAAAGLAALVGDLRADGETHPHAEASSFSRDAAHAADALARLRPGRDRHVAFVGKLIVSKGVDLLAAAWPLVLDAVPGARLVVVGFGAYREALERLLAALAAGDLATAGELAAGGRAAEGGPHAPLRHLQAFLDDLAVAPDRDAYLAAARRLPDRVVLTGRLEHDELAPLLALCEAEVVPSTFPEAFGMVAAEAAACGALPIVARHSGLEEVATALADALPPSARGWLTFDRGPGMVRELAAAVVGWLQAPEVVRDATRRALVATARERFSWDGVARDVLAAAEGRLDDLPTP